MNLTLFFSLPWWFVYVGWFLVLTISLICSFFVMLYGLKYGYRKSVDWLVSSMVAVVQSALVTQPVKVIVVALLLTVIFRKPVEIEKEKTEKDIGNDNIHGSNYNFMSVLSTNLFSSNELF